MIKSAKEARKITEDYETVAFSFYYRSECDRAKGYLEALKGPEVQALVEAAKGLACGVDWNNGTHAKFYRPKLLEALAKFKKEVGE